MGATSNTLLATVERSQRLCKWRKALRPSDCGDMRTFARGRRLYRENNGERETDAVTRHGCLQGKSFEGWAP